MTSAPRCSQCIRWTRLLHTTALLRSLLLLALSCQSLVLPAAVAASDSLHSLLPPSSSSPSSSPSSLSHVVHEVSLDMRDDYSTPELQQQHPKAHADKLYQTALELYSQHKVADAIALAEHALALVDSVPVLVFLAHAHTHAGNIDAALQYFERAAPRADALLPREQARELHFQYAEFLRTHAISRVTTGQRDIDALKATAIEQYERTLAADAALHSNSTLSDTAANHIASSRVHVLNTIGVMLNDLARFEDAAAFFERAVAANASAVEPLGNLALALTNLGRPTDALAVNERALALAPDHSRLLHNAGFILQSLGRADAAAELWKRALALNPTETETLSALASYYADRGDMPTCRSYLEQAQAVADARLARNPTSLDALAAVHANWVRTANAQLPLVYSSVDEILDARRKYEAALQALLRQPQLVLPDPVATANIGSMGYYAEYHGFNDVAIRAQLAQIYRRGSPMLSFTAPHVRAGRHKTHYFARVSSREAIAAARAAAAQREPKRTVHWDDRIFVDVGAFPTEHGEPNTAVHGHDRRIRVGFHSAFMRHHSVGLLMQSVITSLSRDAFEVIILVYEASSEEPTDDVTKRVLESASRVVRLPRRLADAQARVAALELDVLVFTEVGMDPHAYFLAFARLALRTAVFWGHAVTSGIDTVDYFVSSTLFERSATRGQDSDARVPDQQRKFAECVYEMQHLTTFPHWSTFSHPLTREADLARLAAPFRASLSLPPKHVLPTMLLLPQTLYKLHPDMDALLDRILTQASASFLVVLTGTKPWLADAIRARWRRTLTAAAYKRIYFVRLLATHEFVDLCALADVVLDPFPVGGGRSSLEIFAAGTPIVMLAPRTSVLQLTAAMYHVMGFDDLIAHSEDEYVALAVRLAREPALRLFYRRLVTANQQKLYEGEAVTREWERFLVAILAAPPPTERPAGADGAAPRTRGECPQFPTRNAMSTPLDALESQRPPSPDEPFFELGMRVFFTRDESEFVLLQLQTPDDDPTAVVHAFVARSHSHADWLHQNFSAKLLWNGKHRMTQRVVLTSGFEPMAWNDGDSDSASSADRTFTLRPIEIRFGDDLHLIARVHIQRELKRLGLTHDPRQHALLARTVADLERSLPAHRTPEWIAARSFPLQHRFQVVSAPERAEDASAASDGHALWRPTRDCVTLLITTCKRLALFLRTIASLERVLGIAATSHADAAEGWARWFCHTIVVDDNSSAADRAAMRARVPAESFEFYMKGPRERGHARSLAIGLARVRSRYVLYVEDDWEFMGSRSAPASGFLSDALAILRAHRTSLYEPLALVLLNNQQSGWPRTLDVASRDDGQPSARAVRYFVHEFANSDPAHTFAFWPGFSFNPGVWDVYALRQALRDGPTPLTPQDLFETSLDLFEYAFSLRVWRSGLRVAYLADAHAVHIGARVGTNASAYVLNGMPRRYDTPP